MTEIRDVILVFVIIITVINIATDISDPFEFDHGLLRDIAYGSGWINEDVGEIIDLTTPSVYENFTGFTFVQLRNVTDSGNNESVIIEIAGKYLISNHISFSGGSNAEYGVALGVNGIPKENESHFHRLIGSGGDVGSGSTNGILELEVGDEVTIMIMDTQNPVKDPSILTAQFSIILLEET